MKANIVARMCRGALSAAARHWHRTLLAVPLAACVWTATNAMNPRSTAAAANVAVVKLWNWNVHDKKFQQKMYKLFNERHPDIKIDYSSISSTVYSSTLEAAFVAKDPPDIFLPAGLLSPTVLREKGWLLPLNTCAPTEAELKAWMAQFPPILRKFVEGINVFNGKVYNVDLIGEEWAGGNPLFYNTTLFREAGIEKPPSTFSQLRQTAAKITQAGQGKYFGTTLPLRDRPGTWHRNLWYSLAWAAGARGVHGEMLWGPDLKDGRFHHGSPEFAMSLQVWVDMHGDGSVFPGEATMEDEQSKMLLANNKAGMQFGGTWNPGNYLAYNSECDFDVVLTPSPDDGITRGYMWTDPKAGGGGGYVVSSFTKNPRAVWEVIKFISGQEYQEEWVRGGFGISYLPAASKKENFRIPQMYKFVEWANDPSMRRVQPHRSEDSNRALQMAPGVYPTLVDLLDTIYFGKSGFDVLKDFDRKMDAALDAGIKKAQESGIKVTREDFAFPDWDPGKDYEPKKK